jgi:hypothetical protein
VAACADAWAAAHGAGTTDRHLPTARRPVATLFEMKRLRAFLDRLPGGHRPPTGPLTTDEQSDADELREKTLTEDSERLDREQEEHRDPPDREVWRP